MRQPATRILIVIIAALLLFTGSAFVFAQSNNVRLTPDPAQNVDRAIYGIEFSSDNSMLIYVSEQDNVRELYSVPVNSGPPIKLNGNMVSGGNVQLITSYREGHISPDGSRVVYMADQDTDEVRELYSVPINGGTPVKLSNLLMSSSNVLLFRISANSDRVVYIADQDLDEVFELYSVPITGGTPVKLHPALTGDSDIKFFNMSPDGNTVIYMVDEDLDEVFELYSIPITGGTPTKLNGPLVPGGSVQLSNTYEDHNISSDSSRVVYLSTENNNKATELYSVPIIGGTPTKLNHPLASTNHITDFLISPDGSRVIYRDRGPGSVYELYTVPIDGGVATKLNDTLVSGGSVGELTYSYQISPDSLNVVYWAYQDTDDVRELYSVPIAGGAVTKLNAPLNNGDSVSEVSILRISADSQRVVYTVGYASQARGLYSVPLTGGVVTELSPDHTNYQITTDSSTVVYTVLESGEYTESLYSVPISGGVITKLNGTVKMDNPGIFRISPDSSYVVYWANSGRSGIDALYSVSLPGPLKRFDTNDNNAITPADALYVVNRIGDTKNSTNAAADVDGNDTIDATDAELVIEQIGQTLD